MNPLQILSWLRVFRSINAVHPPYGVEYERETTAIQSEKCVARCGNEDDEMCAITARFTRVLQRYTGYLCMHFLLLFQSVGPVSKICNQLPMRHLLLLYWFTSKAPLGRDATKQDLLDIIV
jgi:hypothetical protein